MPYSSPQPMPRGKDQERNRFAWILLAILLLLAALAAPFYLGLIYAGDDLTAYHLPARAFYADCLAKGVAFDWWPDLYGGFHLTGEGQGGTYHPWHWTLYRWLPLRAAFCLEILSSYPLLIAGTYFFLRGVVRRDAALFGAMLFAFSSFALLHLVHVNAIAVVAHLPWLLVCIRRLVLRERGASRGYCVVAIAALTGSQLLLGYPQYVWFSLLAEGTYLCVLLRIRRVRCADRESSADGRWSAQRTLRLCALLVGAKLLGLMLGAVQLLPTVESLSLSTREALSTDFAMTGSLHPLNVLQIVAPYWSKTRVGGENTHELAMYLGAVPLVLVLWGAGAAVGTPRSRRAFWTLVVLGIVALLYAFGGYGPIYGLQTKLPVVGKFRFPCRAVVLVQLCFSAAAAIAFAWLVQVRAGQRNDARRWRLPAAALAISVAVAIGGSVAVNDMIAGPLLVWAGPCLMVMACGLLLFAERKRSAGAILLVAFAAIDLGLYGLTDSICPNAVAPAKLLGSLQGPPGEGRVALDLASQLGGGPRVGNELLLIGASRVDGYAGLEPSRQLDLANVTALRAASVSWVLRSPKTEAIEGLERHNERWLKVPDTLPMVRLTRELEPTNAADDMLAVDAELGTARIEAREPGRIRLSIAPRERSWLVVAESFHPGWKVTVNGRPGEVRRACSDFMGCTVDATTKEIEFVFAPDSLKVGKLLSSSGLGLLLCILAATFWTATRGQHSARKNFP